jgi:acetyltransferase-like isoleucine patch superfamily enzyme
MIPLVQHPAFADGLLPGNIRIGVYTRITGGKAFKSFRGARPDALTIGTHCTLDGVSFAVGDGGKMSIGDYCHFCGAVLLCEMSVTIGNFVSLGWNVTLADTDFHPIEPALRIQDAIACSNLGTGRPRPPILKRAVVIEDDVWIGPGATILKGVRIGAGAFIEPGSLVTRDVPAGVRVGGNPARIVQSLPPSPGTAGEGRGEGDSGLRTNLDVRNHPHPDPLGGSRPIPSVLPEYREREPEQGGGI